MAAPALRVEGLSKRFSLYARPADRVKELLWGRLRKYSTDYWALKEMSFAVPKGSAFGIIGRNGAGKTTLLQVLSGILQPTAGRVVADGRLCALIELGAGFTPDFTGRENAVIYGMVLGLTHRQMLERMDSISAFSEIGDFLDRPVRTYSAGMLLRLAFSVAMHVDADVMVVDEALAVGDVFFQSKCYAALRRMREEGRTLVIVSHDMSVIRSLCTDAALLDRGELVHLGEPNAVAEAYFKRRALDGGNRELPCEGSRTQRYGNAKARLTGYRVAGVESPRSVEATSGAELDVEVEYEFLEPVAAPVCGIMLKNHIGIELFGENTLFQRVPLGPRARGQTLRLRYRQRLHLHNGPYFLTMTAFEEGPGGQVEYIDRWVDACRVDVVGGPYPYMGTCNFQGRIEVLDGAR